MFNCPFSGERRVDGATLLSPFLSEPPLQGEVWERGHETMTFLLGRGRKDDERRDQEMTSLLVRELYMGPYS
jgi:hypothetical protein